MICMHSTIMLFYYYMEFIIQVIQVVSAVFLVIAILIQRSEASVGGAFGGGSDSDGTGSKRRGSEKIIFILTFIIAFIFISSIVIPLIF